MQPQGDLHARFDVGRPPIIQAGDAQPLPIAMNLDNVVFDSPGAYAFILAVDNTEIERLPFRVLGADGLTG